MLLKSRNAPIENQAEPMMGMIQCMRASADQPYQNRPMGTKSEPMMTAGTRYSGLLVPEFASQSYMTIGFG